jgi:protein-S-isoprenylcysteine O-methyltransferase Ste14
MRLLPPVYFLIALLLMAGLHALAPGYRWVAEPWRYLGFVPVAAGFAVAFNAAGLFRKHKTAIRPFKESSALVTEGPYRFTRNPMYLSMVAVLVGTAVVLGSVAPLLVPPVFVWLITTLFIQKEEAMLTERFGCDYNAYRAQVRRWI